VSWSLELVFWVLFVNWDLDLGASLFRLRLKFSHYFLPLEGEEKGGGEYLENWDFGH
jgi:hypothetical protein